MERLTGDYSSGSNGKTFRMLFTFFVLLTSCRWSSGRAILEEDGCSMYDTCKVKQFFRTCSCESDCYRYSTCCRDAPNFDLMRESRERFQCYSEGTPSPVFSKRTCSDGWHGDQAIREACEMKTSVNTTTDFLSQVLVSSNRTETTYWNWNCALCNGEDVHDLIFWTVQVSCFVDGLQFHLSIPRAKENMVYNETGRHWGVIAGQEKFIPCSVNFFQPAFLMGRLRLCAPNIISSCPSHWRDADTEDRCHTYHGERKDRTTGLYYRNAHCAKCNGADLIDLECFGRNYRAVSSVEDSRVLKVIFNLNSWTGEHGEADKDCRIKGRRYDPFLRVCRDLSLGITNLTQQSFDYEFLSSSGEVPLSTPFLFLFLIMAILYPLELCRQ